ncbi:MAG TPA: membrane protein insertase YidC, partial [Rudaea sp.]
MPNTRPFLLFAFLLVGFLLWQAWQQDYGPKPAPAAGAVATKTTDASVPAGNADVPTAAAPGNTAAPPTPGNDAGAQPAAAQTVEVHTDLLHVAIDTRGASVVRADLLAYPLDPKDKNTP